jgi:hypothetical protein
LIPSFNCSKLTLSKGSLKQKVTEAEKHYKNTLDKNSKNYRKKMREELKYLKTSDPKEYWKILNRGREKKQPDIPMEDLFNFFKNLNTAPAKYLVKSLFQKLN